VTARVLADRLMGDGRFCFALADLGEACDGNAVLEALHEALRGASCVAVRRTADAEQARAGVFHGSVTPAEVGAWLDRLVTGEVPLAPLLEPRE